MPQAGTDQHYDSDSPQMCSFHPCSLRIGSRHLFLPALTVLLAQLPWQVIIFGGSSLGNQSRAGPSRKARGDHWGQGNQEKLPGFGKFVADDLTDEVARGDVQHGIRDGLRHACGKCVKRHQPGFNNE